MFCLQLLKEAEELTSFDADVLEIDGKQKKEALGYAFNILFAQTIK